MACQSNCQKTIKYLCKEIFDIKKELISLKEICFDIINTNNVQQQRVTSETMEDNVEVVLNNINVRNKATDYNLMENYSKATAEEPLEEKNTNSNLDWKPTNESLGHEGKLDNGLFLQKIVENQLAVLKEIQDIKTDLKKKEETQSAEIEINKSDLRKLKGTCDNREEDSQNELENIKADLKQLNETFDKRLEDIEHFRKTAAILEENIESIGADLKKLEVTCDNRKADSQTFRKSDNKKIATLNEMNNIKADLKKLNKTCDKRQEDIEYFRKTAATMHEKIESMRADLIKHLEEWW